jgi:mannose-6-phosphate isomerase
MTLQQTGKIDKPWGYEVIWANNEKYCGKLIVFEKEGAKTNLIFHKEKRKSWFVNAGKFKISFVDVVTGQHREAILEEGRTVDLGELSPHAIEALSPNSILFEVGSAETTEDVYMLTPVQAEKTPEQAGNSITI